MKLGSIALLMIAMLSPASLRDDILLKDVIPGMEVKTKWIRALEDSDVVLDGRIKATLNKGSKLIHPENFWQISPSSQKTAIIKGTSLANAPSIAGRLAPAKVHC